MIHNLSQLIERAKSKPKRRIAVAAAEDEAVLKSLLAALKEDIVTPILIGDKREKTNAPIIYAVVELNMKL